MIQSPSLDFQHVLDICSQEAYRTEGTILLVASNPFYIKQFEPRLSPYRQLIIQEDFEAIPADCSCVILAEPDDLERWAKLLQASSVQSILIISAGRIARFLPEALSQPIGHRQAENFINRSGFSFVWRIGINTINSLIWGRLMQGIQALGLQAIADYCLYQMRANYVKQNSWGVIQLFLGRRV